MGPCRLRRHLGRRCRPRRRRPLWGKNLAVFLGELLQAFLEALPHPFAAFGFHFQFDLFQAGQSAGRRFDFFHRAEGGFFTARLRSFSRFTITMSRCAPRPVISHRHRQEVAENKRGKAQTMNRRRLELLLNLGL